MEPSSELTEIAVGMVLVAKRGRGRRWQVIGPALSSHPPAWRLWPLGPDVGGYGGVKAISRDEADLLADWALA